MLRKKVVPGFGGQQTVSHYRDQDMLGNRECDPLDYLRDLYRVQCPYASPISAGIHWLTVMWMHNKPSARTIPSDIGLIIERLDRYSKHNAHESAQGYDTAVMWVRPWK